MTTAQEEESKEQWVTTPQAIKMLGIPSTTFYRRLKHYKFERRKGGRDERISLVDLNEIKSKLGM